MAHPGYPGGNFSVHPDPSSALVGRASRYRPRRGHAGGIGM